LHSITNDTTNADFRAVGPIGLSLINDCVFSQDDIIFNVYIYNGIILGSSDKQLRGITNKLQNFKLSIEDEGHLVDYVGVNIKKLKDSVIELLQQALINSIIADVALGNSNSRPFQPRLARSYMLTWTSLLSC
jgi:hypothetical protein